MSVYKYIIGNWKSNKNEGQAREWFEIFVEKKNAASISVPDLLKIIICPPFHLLFLVKKLIKDYSLPFLLGAQDVSAFPEGAYTGEISASQLAEYAQYVIIGHSERRKYFKEDDKLLFQKAQQATKANLLTIYCVRDEKTPFPKEVSFVAYEPVYAIGTGVPENPQIAEEVARFIKQRGGKKVIYGGSVTPTNTADFFKKTSIDGVLPGGASLDPLSFLGIIQHASSYQT